MHTAIDLRRMGFCLSLVQAIPKRLPLIRGHSFLLKVTDSLGRYFLKLVSPRLPDEYGNLVVCGHAPALTSEFLNGRITLGTALTVLVQKVLGESCDFESLVATTNIMTVFNLVAKGAYFASQGIAIDLGQVAATLVQTGSLQRLPTSFSPIVGQIGSDGMSVELRI